MPNSSYYPYPALRVEKELLKLEHMCYWTNIKPEDEQFFNGVAYAVGRLLGAWNGKNK